jgi:hypothetical protein
MTMTTRKALATLIREAAAAQGIRVTAVYPPDGRLAYQLGDGTAVYTPGEAAARLGIVWP